MVQTGYLPSAPEQTALDSEQTALESDVAVILMIELTGLCRSLEVEATTGSFSLILALIHQYQNLCFSYDLC